MPSDSDILSLVIEFGGGLELLFSNVRNHKIEVPSSVPVDNSTDGTGKDMKQADLTYLIYHLRYHVLKERSELFFEEKIEGKGTVRPGILVIVNNTDWELEGEGDYKLENGDEIAFISTLHGG